MPAPASFVADVTPDTFVPDSSPKSFVPDKTPRSFIPDDPEPVSATPEPPQESRFNIPQRLGVSTTQGGGRVPLASFKETMVAPIEAAGETLTHTGIPLPRLEITEDDSTTVAVGKEVVNLAIGVPEFFSSALGVGAVGAGAVAPVLTAGAFTVDLLNSLGEQVKSTYSNWDSMTKNEKAVALTDIAGTGAFATLTGAHTVKGVKAKLEAMPQIETKVQAEERAQLIDELNQVAPLTATEVAKAEPVALDKASQYQLLREEAAKTDASAEVKAQAEISDAANKQNQTIIGMEGIDIKSGYAKYKAEREAKAKAKVEPEVVQGAIATPGPPLAPTSVPPVSKTPKSQREIITDLAKGLSLPIRFGRLRTTKFAGYFLKVQDLIGSKKANDIPIVSHEVGHKLDSEFSISSDPALRAELDHLGDPSIAGSRSSWTPSKTIKYKLGEGMAEFTRLWLTDPPAAATAAPNLHTHFESILNANKDFGDVMRQAREDIQTWRTAEPQARLRSHISVGGNPNKTRYTLSQLTRDVVDDLHFVRLAVDDAQALSGRDIAPSQNPYLLARNLRGSYGMADTFIRRGVADFNSKEVTLGTSLEHALTPVAGRINDFRDWIVSKQARELHRQGKTTGLVPNDVDIVANRFDADPAFQEAFTKVKAWNDSLLKYAVDSGLVTPEGAAAMRAMNQDYVPFHRVFEVGAGEPSALEGAGTGRGLNVGKPGSLMGRQGSQRDIVDPLETMVKNAYSIITASEKAAINTAVADLANSPGMGKWVEQVATPKEQVKVGLEKVKQELEAAGADLTHVPDDLLLTFFQNGKQAPFGENIIRVTRNGKGEFYRLKQELFEAFHALDLEDSSKLIQMMSAPTQLLRAGVTLSPDFALANAMRDTFSAAVISKYNAFPFEVTARGVAALLRDPKLVAEWAASGGKSAIEANYFDRTKLQNFLKEKITKDLTPAEQALVYAKSPLVALRQLSSFAEEATRIGEYQKAFDSLRKSGMPEGEARRMAAFEARDRQDFAKGGAKTKIVRHLAAFWNAQLQANVKLVQAFRDRPVKTMLAGMAFITLPKLLEQAVNWNDPDYWDRPQWERDLMFLIPVGKGKDGHTRFIRIPTPFEPGIIFGTLPGRLLQWAKQNKPDAMTSFPEMFLRQSIPNPIPQTLMTVFADFLSGKKGWDVWRGRTVVPESLAQLPPEMQWTQQTSLTARKLGKTLGFSPMKIDHIINSTAGGLGKQITHQISDRAISAVTGEPRTATGAVPGGRFVTAPAAVSSESIDQFYKTLDALKTDTERKKNGGTLELNHNLDSTFSTAEIQMAEWRKLSKKTKSESEKARYQELILKKAREVMARYNALK